MKTLIALLLIVAPASAKTWSNAEDTVAVASEGSGFRYWYSDEEPYSTFCTVKSVVSTVATLACDNGDAPAMDTVSSELMLLDGEMLTLEEE